MYNVAERLQFTEKRKCFALAYKHVNVDIKDWVTNRCVCYATKALRQMLDYVTEIEILIQYKEAF